MSADGYTEAALRACNGPGKPAFLERLQEEGLRLTTDEREARSGRYPGGFAMQAPWPPLEQPAAWPNPAWIVWAATTKRYVVTVELRGPSEVVEREWPAHLVENAEDAYVMTFSHLSDAQKDRVAGHNVVEVS